MSKVINNYETLFIVDATLGEEAIKALVDKFTSLIAANGTVASAEEWGTRNLAYPIDKKKEGYYVLVKFSSEPEFTSELERVLEITDGIMRYIVIKL